MPQTGSLHRTILDHLPRATATQAAQTEPGPPYSQVALPNLLPPRLDLVSSSFLLLPLEPLDLLPDLINVVGEDGRSCAGGRRVELVGGVGSLEGGVELGGEDGFLFAEGGKRGLELLADLVAEREAGEEHYG
jgi:hypothetical protein